MMSRRFGLTLLIAGLGAAGGALTALAMNLLSSVAAGEAGVAGYVRYHFNVAALSVIGATVAPVVSWAMLRTVPIWRAVVQPSAAALAAGAVCMVLAPSSYVVAIPAAAALASLHLHRRYPATRTEIAGARAAAVLE